jgi:thioredoxin 1
MPNETENTNTENGAKPVAISALNFKAEVLESSLPVLVEFWTGWSQPCRVSDSVLQDVARDLAGKINVVKVDADASLDLSLYYEIQSIPTLIYFVKGRLCFRIVGTASKEAILAKLQTFSQ